MTEEKTNGKQSHNLPYYPPNHRFVPFSADGGNGSPRTNPSRADVFHQTFKMRDQKQSYHRHPLPPQFSSHRFVPFSADGGSGGPRSNPSRADVFHQTFERRNQKQSYHRHPLPPQFSSHRFVPFSADGGNGSPRTNPSRADVFHQTFKMRDQKQSYHRHPLPPHRANLRYVQPMFSGQGGSEDIRMNPSHTDVLPQSWTPGYQNQFSRIPAQARGSIHGPHVNMQPQESAFSHSGFKRTIASWGKTRERPEPKRRKARKRSTCLWCGSICENGLPRHIQENCEDGLFRAACDVIHMMFGKSGVRVTKLDIKTAHAQIMKCPDFKSELITRIRKQMSKRITTKLEHTVRAPRSNGSAFKTFQGLDAMVSVFFWLFGFKMPVEAELVSYDFTCFDADISADVKRFIFKWVQMTQKTARRDALNAITHTSQDPLSIGDCNVVLDVSPEGWKALENEEYEFLHHESDLLEDIGSMVKEFELRLLRKYPTEKFAWLRCFLVAFRAFSVEALELKTLPDGEVRYRTIKSDERKEILGSMSTFVMQNYDTLVKSFRDVVESQYNATELRLQLLRAFLAMPSDRRASDLTTLAEGLVRRLSEDIPHGFSSEFGDVPQIIFPGYYVPSKTLFIDKLAQADLCHIVHVHGSRASRMCLVDSNKGTLEPISEGQNSLHSTALDLFINNGLNAKAVLSLPDFIKYQTLRITSNEQWKAMTKFASRFATLDTLIITKCASTVLEIGTMKCFRDLRCLSLVQNHISTLQPAVFNHFTGLEKLDLSFNGLKTIPPGVFNVCKSLQEVYLDKNEICTLSPRGFEGLSNLKILILRSNKLHSLPEGVFHGLESLETLSLWANQLQSLPVKLFQTVKSLKELRLGQNQLQSLDQGTFDGLKFLETLALYNNKLKGLPVGLFQKLKSLRVLELDSNQLQSFDKGTFDDLKSLKYLDFEGNPLDYTQLDLTTFDSLNGVEMDPDLPTIRSRMRESLERKEKQFAHRWKDMRRVMPATGSRTFRLSIYPEGNRSAMKAIEISEETSLYDLVSATAKALGSQKTHLYLESGALIEDITLISDGDILMLGGPPLELMGNLGNVDGKQSYFCNPRHSLSQCDTSRELSAQGWSGGPSINQIPHQTRHMMKKEQSYHLHPLPIHRFDIMMQSGRKSRNPSRARHVMGFQGRSQGYQNRSSPLPSQLTHEGRTGGHTHSLDVSRQNRAPTMGLYVPTPASQGLVVQPNVDQPSPMHVVEQAQAGGLIPRVNPPLGTVISHPGVNVQIQNFQEQSRSPSMYPNRTGGKHMPNIANRDNKAPQGTAAVHLGFKRTTSSRGKTERKTPKRRKRKRKRSICHWCGSICESGLPRHIQEKCEDGLFRAACDVIRRMFGNGRVRVTKEDIKKAYVEVIRSPDFKSELVTCIRDQMTNRIEGKIKHTVRAPCSIGSVFKTFQGLDAMVCVFFWLFGLEMPVEGDLVSYDFTGFDAEISAEVKQFILKWIQMTRKTAGRNVLNTITHTSQDSLLNGDCKVVLDVSADDWNNLEKMEYGFLHDEKNLWRDMVKRFNMRLLHVAPTEKFAWLRCFLVAFRVFSVEALELKSQQNGEVRYRPLSSSEGKVVLGSMSKFVQQNYDTLVESFSDIVESQDHATELRLQLLRAILAMPSDRRSSHLITLAKKLVGRLSEEVRNRFSIQFGDVLQFTDPGFLLPPQTLSIAEATQTDICHFVHVQGSRSSRMCHDEGILKPIPEGQNALHSTALDLFINCGLNSETVSSLPYFLNSQTLRITSNERWKAVSAETKFASWFSKLDALIITKCVISKLGIGTLEWFRGLRCLRLVGNDISTLQPGVFDHLTRLEILDLSFNRLKNIKTGVLNACKSLREVRLNRNNICTLPPRAFEGLSNLKVLILVSNKLRTLAKDVFHGLESLEILELWKNKLQNLPVGLFETLKSLKELHLGSNQLKKLEKGTFHVLRSLEVLYLYHNKLQFLPAGIFQTLKSLKSLDLSYNQLRTLDKGTFDDLKSVEEMWLGRNPLDYTQIDPRTFDSLNGVEMDIDFTSIQSRRRKAQVEKEKGLEYGTHTEFKDLKSHFWGLYDDESDEMDEIFELGPYKSDEMDEDEVGEVEAGESS